jgi:hypothetical protein
MLRGELRQKMGDAAVAANEIFAETDKKCFFFFLPPLLV